MVEQIKTSQIIKLEGHQHIIIGDSGSGKTCFLQSLLQSLKQPKSIYIYTQDAAEWKNTENILSKTGFELTYCSHSPFDKHEKDTLFQLEKSAVVFDDFMLSKAHEDDFFRFVNFNVRHKKLVLFLLVHSIFKNNLFNKVINSPSLFLTACVNNIQLSNRLDKIYKFQSRDILVQNLDVVDGDTKPILYITPRFMVNNIQLLFTKGVEQSYFAKMFRNDKIYLLMDESKYSYEEDNSPDADDISSRDKHYLENLLNEFYELYPKRKAKIKILVTSLYNFLVENQFLDQNGKEINIYGKRLSLFDFISSSQNPGKTPHNRITTQILGELRKHKFRVPRLTLINAEFKKCLT